MSDEILLAGGLWLFNVLSGSDSRRLRTTVEGGKVMALSEVERLTRSVNTLTDALEEVTERNKRLEAIVPDVEALLWFCDKHFENVRSNEKIATEKELTGLKAHTRLREIFPKGEEEDA